VPTKPKHQHELHQATTDTGLATLTKTKTQSASQNAKPQLQHAMHQAPQHCAAEEWLPTSGKVRESPVLHETTKAYPIERL